MFKLYRFYDIPNSSNPLKPVMYLDKSNFIHFIPSGHVYPSSTFSEQNESGMAKLLRVTLQYNLLVLNYIITNRFKNYLCYTF